MEWCKVMVGVNFGKTTIVDNKKEFNQAIKKEKKSHPPVTKEAIIKAMNKLNIQKKKLL